ncbi:MAG: hypothetical protein IJ008_05545 [Clostridia bacterium]|nr:hypothetical protein [Clostridia bacterium]
MTKNFLFTTAKNRTQSENDFHKRRRAFLIYMDKVCYIPVGSEMSHFEYSEKLGIEKDVFEKLCRGYALDGDLYFYKGHFVYDEELINYAEKFIKEIQKELNLKEDMKVYFGLNVGKEGEIWKPSFRFK